jgi:hypothetical protein
LQGWKRSPRALNQPSLGIWTVEDGVITGGQEPPGFGIGSYLVSEETSGDFELKIDARPDWPAARRHWRILRQRAGRLARMGLQLYRREGCRRCEIPHLTTWINGVKIADLDTAKMKAPKWDPKVWLDLVGRTVHMALEVHSNGANDKLGKDRWAPGAACRWRNISVKTL